MVITSLAKEKKTKDENIEDEKKKKEKERKTRMKDMKEISITLVLQRVRPFHRESLKEKMRSKKRREK